MMDLAPVRHGAPPPFFKHALDLLLESFNFYSVLPRELEVVTAKQTDKYITVNFHEVVWPRLSYTVLEPVQWCGSFI